MAQATRNKTFLVTAAIALLAAMFITVPAATAGTPTCFGQKATIVAQPGVPTVGTAGADVIVGTSGADVIRGRGGADLICSRGGADRVLGGPGNDWIKLGPGADRASGGRGRDVILGGQGPDLLRGRRGNDAIDGQGGSDKCYGGKGIDSLTSCNESAPSPPSQSPTVSLSAAENQMVGLLQSLRSAYGVGALNVSVSLSSVARDWSERLPSGFYHNPNVGNQIPSGWTAWGENIAYNGSVDAAFTALANSPGHLANMVNAGYTHVGIGIYVSGGRVYVTQVFARY